jgi:hypothetical protein
MRYLSGILVVLAMFVLAPGARADQPHMERALDHLKRAREALERAKSDKGGHRERALTQIDHAETEVKAGIGAGESDDTPKGRRRGGADPNAAWTTACRDDTERRVREDHKGFEKMTLAPETIEAWQESDNETGVAGLGQFQAGGGKWKSFSFHCIYNTKKGKVASNRIDVKK